MAPGAQERLLRDVVGVLGVDGVAPREPQAVETNLRQLVETILSVRRVYRGHEQNHANRRSRCRRHL